MALRREGCAYAVVLFEFGQGGAGWGVTCLAKAMPLRR